MDKPTTAEVARFFDKVQITKHCWLWTGCIVGGYGQFGFRGSIIRAHRFSYELFVGPIELEKHILHRRECGNRNCVNPHHLYMGTNDDNMRDKATWGNVAIGERHGQSKLSESDVISIRKIHKNTSQSYEDTAAIFGVDPTQISNIVRGIYWRHLLPAGGKLEVLP